MSSAGNLGVAAPPDPGQARTLDDLADRLRLLKIWAGSPSYGSITARVAEAWTAAGRPPAELPGKTTVVDCFRAGRRRVNADLVIAVVQVLLPDIGYTSQWRQALAVIGGQAEAAGQVRVQDELPPDLPTFAGRPDELEQLHRAAQRGGAVCVITGMAGVGKTRLAVHAAHQAHRSPVLFVNLRGFDRARPPADPAAVLEGFLRLLGVPGHQIPPDQAGRTAAFRARLAGVRSVIVLDNAADAEQVASLLPNPGEGSLVLITSRRALPGTRADLNLGLDVFGPAEAREYLTAATPEVELGEDPEAVARIAERCGHLPLALGLIAAHITGTPGWTLTDHAERLDERYAGRHLETAVEAAFDLSYRQLPADRKRLLRLIALHPGPDLDGAAAAALTSTDRAVAEVHLAELGRDHLLQRYSQGRYVFHDLIRAFAAARARDEESPRLRRTALSGLFDYYLGATAAAMNALHPGESASRPAVPVPSPPVPELAVPRTALAWLDNELPNLSAVAAHSAAQDGPDHAIRLSRILFRYFCAGRQSEARAIHEQALHAARRTGGLLDQAHVLNNLGGVMVSLGQDGPGAELLHESLALFRHIGDLTGQTRPLSALGMLATRRGHDRSAIACFEQALELCRRIDSRSGQAYALGNLGDMAERLHRPGPATAFFAAALTLFRELDDPRGCAWMLNLLGRAETRVDRFALAHEHLGQALEEYRQLGHSVGTADVLANLGALHIRQGQAGQAGLCYREALALYREAADAEGEACALIGLGEAAADRPEEAIRSFTEALDLATHVDEQARAHNGLARAYRALGQVEAARAHSDRAPKHRVDPESPENQRITVLLANLREEVPVDAQSA